MKSIFKSKKSLGLLGATFLVIAGCTSEDVNYDIPVNSNELVDQNVAYKSETVSADVEEKPSINSKDIAKSEPSAAENTAEEKPAKAEVAKPDTTEEKVTVAEETVTVTETETASTTSPTELNVADEVAKANAEAEENAKLMDTKSSVENKADVIVPPPAYSDETVNFTDTSYKAPVEEEDEFARAVAEAEARHGGKKTEPARDENVKSKNEKKSYKLNVTEDKERNITFLSTVIYHSNAKADISARDERVLKNVAKFAKKHDAVLRVVGNSSSRSKNMKEAQNKIANFDLSILRAQKVRDLLIKYGVPSDKVFISAVSDTEKISEENMPINEAVNRRTEIYINY